MASSEAFGAAFIGLAILAGIRWIFRSRTAVSRIAGPPSPSWIFGHMKDLILCPQYGEREFEWQRAYGPVYRIKGCFGQDRLMVADHVSIQHILNSPSFEHTPDFENKMYMVEGAMSVSYVRGEAHKRLRAALYPAFSAAAVKKYQPALQGVARELAEQLEVASNSSSVDVCPLFAIATLGAVCRGVFGISTQDLGSDLLANIAQLGAVASKSSAGSIIADALSAHLPPWALAYLPVKPFSILRKGRELKAQLGLRIVQDKRAEMGPNASASVGGDVYGAILSSLAAADATANQKLSDDELAGQVGRFLIAGTQSATNALAFALLELAKDPELQDRLRAEVCAAGGAQGSVEYDDMSVLNALIKEVLRVYAGVPFSDRIVVRDDSIPVSDGNVIPVRKGQVVTIATAEYHRLRSCWGADAHEFNTARWLNSSSLDETAKQGAFGPYANLSTFLGGTRSCIGWRFAILEMQIFLATLIQSFSFSLPANVLENEKDSFVYPRLIGTLSPILVESGQRGVPLIVKGVA